MSTYLSKCRFLKVSDRPQDGSIGIRIMQWNVLAQGFIGLDEFVYCSKNMLQINRRCLQISSVISYYQPDFICLQEVDIIDEIMNHLNLSNNNTYKFQFLPKLNSPCLFLDNNYGPDGVAIIYQSARFCLTDMREIILDSTQPRKALYCQFEPVGLHFNSKPCFIHLICLHLKAQLNCEHIRLKEGEHLLNYLNELIGENQNFSSLINPFFICGDFNAEPSESVINLIKQSHFRGDLKFSYVPFTNHNGVADEEITNFTTWKFRRNKSDGKAAEICRFSDYIWYLNKWSDLVGAWSLPTKDNIGNFGLPTEQFPSDHLNLVADFSLNTNC